MNKKTKIMTKTTMNKITNVEDLFLEEDTTFFHFFPMEKKDSILRDGLLCSKDESSKSSEHKGIYAVWYNDERVISAIADSQACVQYNGSIVSKLCLLKINLKHYNIIAKDIAPDLNGGGKPDINSFCCKIMHDIYNIREGDIVEWNGGNSDTYGIAYYNLDGYNIKYKPSDYDENVRLGLLPKIQWKSYD